MTVHQQAELDDRALQAQVSGKLVLRRHAHHAQKPSARRCSPSIASAGWWTTSADDGTRARPQRAAELDAWRADLQALYDGRSAGRAIFLEKPVQDFGLRHADFIAVIDGMAMDVVDIRAPDQATLDLYCDRVACAVGRLSTRIFGMDEGPGVELAQELGRALQLTNILRDLDEDAAMGRLYLPGELLRQAGITATDPDAVIGDPHVDGACRALARSALERFAAADRTDALQATRPAARAQGDGSGLPYDFARYAGSGLGAATVSCAHRQAAASVDRRAMQPLGMKTPRETACVHVVGAGMAGLSAAVTLAGQGARVVLSEAARQAGGRCRSYHDSLLEMTIDNGNHLVLTGNPAVRRFLGAIGAQDRLTGPSTAAFPFFDVATGRTWTLRPNDGVIPWWILDANRRVPGTGLGEYVAIASLMRRHPGRRIDEVLPCKGALWERFLRPLLVSVLNTSPEEDPPIWREP